MPGAVQLYQLSRHHYLAGGDGTYSGRSALESESVLLEDESLDLVVDLSID